MLEGATPQDRLSGSRVLPDSAALAEQASPEHQAALISLQVSWPETIRLQLTESHSH